MGIIPSLEKIGMGADKVVFKEASGQNSGFVFIQERSRGALKDEIARMEQIATKALRLTKSIDQLAVHFEIDRRFSVLTLKVPKADRDLERHIALTLPLSARFQLIEGELEAIKQLHDLDLEHGDIKPENFLTYTGRNGEQMVRLADWGKTKESKESSYHFGNRRFCAPEGYGSKKGEVYSTALVMIRTLEESLGDGFVTSSTPKGMKKSVRGVEAFRVQKGITGSVIDRVGDAFKLAFHTKGKEQREIHGYIQTLILNLYTKITSENPEIDSTSVSTPLRNLGILLKEMTLDDPTRRPSIKEAAERYAPIKREIGGLLSTISEQSSLPLSPSSSSDGLSVTSSS